MSVGWTFIPGCSTNDDFDSQKRLDWHTVLSDILLQPDNPLDPCRRNGICLQPVFSSRNTYSRIAQSNPTSDPRQVAVPRPWGTQADQETGSSSHNDNKGYALSRWLHEPAGASPFHNIAFVAAKPYESSASGQDTRSHAKDRAGK